MSKLYFKYGCMGSCKTVQALTAQFNYEERGMGAWLLKPETDTRDGDRRLRSRIGLEKEADVIGRAESVLESYLQKRTEKEISVIIVDECQFLSVRQVDELREIVDEYGVAVLCFGLRTDFQTKFFPGSSRLMEIADCIEEVKTMCRCGKKAIVNARVDENGNVLTSGDQIMLGGNETYEAMCYKCYRSRAKK